MKKIILDKRLQAIANMVVDKPRLADIGTDHGYLIAYLAKMDKISKGYACDINEKPLKSAKATLSTHDLTHMVDCVLTNGLVGLNYKDIDCVTIAGMGGDLILSILDNSQWDFTDKTLILQPMTKADKLRIGLLSRGFDITQEIPVAEGKFVYSILKVGYTGVKMDCSPTFSFIGKIPLSTSEYRDSYLMRIYDNISKRLEGLKDTVDKDEDIKIYETIIKDIKELL